MTGSLRLIVCSAITAGVDITGHHCGICGGSLPEKDYAQILWFCVGNRPLLVGCEACLKTYLLDEIWREVCEEPWPW